VSALPSGVWLAAAGPAQMYKRKVDPDALIEVMSRPQILLSLAACLAAVVLGLLARRVLRATPLSAEHRQFIGQALPLATIAGLVFVLALIWQPKLGAVQIVFGAIAVGLARGLVGFTRPFMAFLLRAGGDTLRQGAFVRVGPVCGRLLVVRPRTSVVAGALDESDPAALSGSIVTFSNALFFRSVQTVEASLPCEVVVVVPTPQAPGVACRLERAAALTDADSPRAPALRAEIDQLEIVTAGERSRVTLTLDVTPGEVRVTRDRVLQRYLELAPMA
jgi:hypothetical protein